MSWYIYVTFRHGVNDNGHEARPTHPLSQIAIKCDDT